MPASKGHFRKAYLKSGFALLIFTTLAVGLIWFLSCAKKEPPPIWDELPGINVYDDVAHYGSWEQTRMAYDSLLAQARRQAERRVEWEMLLKIGILHEYEGNLDSAKFFFLSAQSFSEKYNLLSHQALVFLRLGVLEGKIGDLNQSEYYFDRAAGYGGGAWGDSLQARYLSYRANLHFMQEHYDDAISFYQQAFGLYQRLQIPRGEWLCMMSLGLAHASKKEFAGAQEWYARADSSAWGRRDIYARTLSALNRGELLYEKGEFSAALQKFLDARKQISGLIGRNLESADVKWQSYLGEARSLWAQNKRWEAEEPAKNAIRILEEQTWQISSDAIKRHYLEHRQAAFAEMVGINLGLQKPREALEAAERGRARAFLDLLQERGINLRAPDELRLASRRKYERELNLLASLDEEKFSAHSPETLPEKILRGSLDTALPPISPQLSPELRSLSSVVPVNFQALADLAKTKKTTLLEYFVLDDSLAIFIIKPNGRFAYHTVRVSRDSLTKTVADLLSQITARRSRADWRDVTLVDDVPAPADSLAGAQSLRQLYSWLIAPIESYLPADEDQVITIIPHDVLFLLPFPALLDGDKKYLVEKHTLATAPAAGVLKFTGQKRQLVVSQQDPHLLIVGNPHYPQQSGLRPLQGAAMEANVITRLFPDDRSVLLTGPLAYESRVKRAAPDFTIIHFATHGLFNERAPMLSALVFAADSLDDGYLTCAEIFNMPQLHADLIVLSACQTGRGEITGDGILGLSRAFLYAGTPALIVTQWSIDDEATSFLMSEFYQEYHRGGRKALALRQAQLRALAQYPAPFYWAAFALVGED